MSANTKKGGKKKVPRLIPPSQKKNNDVALNALEKRMIRELTTLTNKVKKLTSELEDVKKEKEREMQFMERRMDGLKKQFGLYEGKVNAVYKDYVVKKNKIEVKLTPRLLQGHSYIPKKRKASEMENTDC